MNVFVMALEQFFEILEKIIFVDNNFSIFVIKSLNFFLEHVSLGLFDALGAGCDATELVLAAVDHDLGHTLNVLHMALNQEDMEFLDALQVLSEYLPLLVEDLQIGDKSGLNILGLLIFLVQVL